MTALAFSVQRRSLPEPLIQLCTRSTTQRLPTRVDAL